MGWGGGQGEKEKKSRASYYYKRPQKLGGTVILKAV